MVFEVGKYYKHNTGKVMHVIGEMETEMWGTTLVAETDSGQLIPVGVLESHSVNWAEITCQSLYAEISHECCGIDGPTEDRGLGSVDRDALRDIGETIWKHLQDDDVFAEDTEDVSEKYRVRTRSNLGFTG